MEEPLKNNNVESEYLRTLKHDIRNQLSNIYLALEQLRYEIPENAGPDCSFYIDTIAESCTKLTSLLKE